MNNRNQLLKDLAKSIIEVGALSNETVDFIHKTLSRKEQKALLSYLKLESAKQTVTITSAIPLSDGERKELEKQYADRKIKYYDDESIGAGLIIRDFDTIYDASVRSYIDQTINTLKK